MSPWLFNVYMDGVVRVASPVVRGHCGSRREPACGGRCCTSSLTSKKGATAENQVPDVKYMG